MVELTLIIVSFNSAKVIDQCQSQLLDAATYPVLVIDNASPDQSAIKLKNRYPEIEVIPMQQNIGYGRAANVGLRKTQTRFALLLNPDLFVSVDEIQKILDYARKDEDNTAIWGPATKRSLIAEGPPVNVDWISGSAMLFNIEKIKQVGLFDENIFLFSEETDLCERTIAAGHGIKLCPDVFFDHLVGQASPFDPKVEYMKWWHFGWSQCYRMTKNGHCTVFRNPRRKHLSYRLHSLISISQRKRMKWKAKADGASAFLKGIKAFDRVGHPRTS